MRRTRQGGTAEYSTGLFTTHVKLTEFVTVSREIRLDLRPGSLKLGSRLRGRFGLELGLRRQHPSRVGEASRGVEWLGKPLAGA